MDDLSAPAELLRYYGIPKPVHRHRAMPDVEVTAEVFRRLLEEGAAAGHWSTLLEGDIGRRAPAAPAAVGRCRLPGRAVRAGWRIDAMRRVGRSAPDDDANVILLPATTVRRRQILDGLLNEYHTLPPRLPHHPQETPSSAA
ncbi:hypothetical protein B7755_008900 [Streptomyces sp. NBS 14/10]|uniref:hypothetical protein n=1 Tax=Streptomyces sp. NBS 14/10 TaxID=1945643 RepID=UPI00211B3F42|nr:hypothetical protein [Streptomyces sp. NBS 14/10]KAK1178241.1 hypothetical protein B7755_008900 [Streptomyces sp. NBS 14/10]